MRILLLLLPFLFSAFADDFCQESEKTIDLSQKGGSLYPLEITNQDGLGICYAEVSQKLLRAATREKIEFSKIDLAIQYKADQSHPNSSNFLDSGDTCALFNRLGGKSICLKGDNPVEKLSALDPYKQVKILDTLETYFNSTSINKQNDQDLIYKEAASVASKCKLDKIVTNDFLFAFGFKALPLNETPTVDHKTLLNAKNARAYILKKYPTILPSLQSTPQKISAFNKFLEEVEGVEQCMNNGFLNTFNFSFSNYACKIQLSDEIISLKKFGFTLRDLYKMTNTSGDIANYIKKHLSCKADGKMAIIPKNLTCSRFQTMPLAFSKQQEKYLKSFSNFIDSSLSSNLPVGVNMCTRMFSSSKITTINLKSKEYECAKEGTINYVKGEGNHAVTIIGKRCNKGKREYLVQNSWGAGCGAYSQDFECTGKGGIWVSLETLSKNTRSLSRLYEKK